MVRPVVQALISQCTKIIKVLAVNGKQKENPYISKNNAILAYLIRRV